MKLPERSMVHIRASARPEPFFDKGAGAAIRWKQSNKLTNNGREMLML